MNAPVCDHGHPLGECPECQRETVYRMTRDKGAAGSTPPVIGPEDTLVDRADALHTLLEQALARGIRDERARVLRIRNKAFAGKAVDDDMRKLLADFDGMLLRGEDDAT